MSNSTAEVELVYCTASVNKVPIFLIVIFLCLLSFDKKMFSFDIKILHRSKKYNLIPQYFFFKCLDSFDIKMLQKY